MLTLPTMSCANTAHLTGGGEGGEEEGEGRGGPWVDVADRHTNRGIGAGCACTGPRVPPLPPPHQCACTAPLVIQYFGASVVGVWSMNS